MEMVSIYCLCVPLSAVSRMYHEDKRKQRAGERKDAVLALHLPTGVPYGEDRGSPGIEGVLVTAQLSQKGSPLFPTVSVLWTKARKVHLIRKATVAK